MTVARSLSISRATIIVVLVLTFMYLSSIFSPNVLEVLSFYPSNFLLSCIRASFATFWLVTNEHLTHWLTVLALFIFDKLVHDCWSRVEVFVFAGFVNIGALTLTSCSIYCLPVDGSLPVYGNAAFVAAVSVVSTQFDADRFLVGYSGFGLKSKNGFCCGLLLFVLSACIDAVSWNSVLLYITGFYMSWFYLRFLQHHPQRKYGDHRAVFSLSKFFPGPLEKWVAVPSNLIYRILLRTKLCPSLERQSEIVSTAAFAVNIPGLTSDSDRHRRIALKALNERLFSKPDRPQETVDWPSLEEGESNPPGHVATSKEATDAVTPSATLDVTNESSPDVSFNQPTPTVATHPDDTN